MANFAVAYDKLIERIEVQRKRRGMSKRQVAAEIGIPPGTFTRLGKNQGVADDTFVTLMNWLGADESIQPFLTDNRPQRTVVSEEDADAEE